MAVIGGIKSLYIADIGGRINDNDEEVTIKAFWARIPWKSEAK